jgi:hypothetical protein
MQSHSDAQKRKIADMAEANMNRTVTFRFDERDKVEIERLEAEGFHFATITMRDKRGYERAFKVWMPPGYENDAGAGS